MCKPMCDNLYLDIENDQSLMVNTNDYISDGVTYDDYLRLKNEALEQADCCQLYFKKNAFNFDQANSYIDGMKMCIHCFFVLNLDKFHNKISLSSTDKNMLDKYLLEFSKEHNVEKCNKESLYGVCLLCDYLKDKKSRMDDKCKIYDKVLVKNKREKYTLYL